MALCTHLHLFDCHPCVSAERLTEGEFLIDIRPGPDDSYEPISLVLPLTLLPQLMDRLQAMCELEARP
jgi:hypothetical protein